MMADCLLMWNIFLVLFQISHCLTVGEKNVCFNSNLGQYYCCAHFEEKNRTCVECPTGFKSIQGQPCEPCQENLYGKRCVLKCSCFNWQRCDNIEGCVEQLLPPSKDITTGKTGFETSQTLYVTIPEIDKTDYTTKIISVSSTVDGNTFRFDKEKQTSSEITSATGQPRDFAAPEIEETGISKTHLMMYSGTVTGIIFILGACHFYFRLRKRVRNKHVLHRNVESSEQRFNNTSELGEVSEGIYQLIDERNMLDFTEHTNPYLEIVDSSRSSETSRSITSIICATESGYLHPYNSLIVTTEIHVYEKQPPTEETEKEMAATNEDGDFEHQDLTRLHSSCESDINSSGSSNEGSDSNGYLNPRIDNENVYDISVLGSTFNED